MISTVKISQLPLAIPLTGTENIIVNQNATTRLSTVQSVVGLATINGAYLGISSSGTSIASGPITELNFIGEKNAFAVNGTSVDISIQGGESYWVESTSGIHTLANVGIATTNPIQTFQVGSAGTSVVVIDNNGNLGLGTTNPTSKIHCNGDINLDDGGTYTTTLQTITPTADRTVSIPDATGTVALVAGSSGQLIYNNAGAYAGASNSSVGASGDITLSLNGALSTPPLKLDGTWITGGTGSTTKPHVLIEPAGTTSTAWSTSGTGLGVNAASGFTGNLLDLQVNGSSKASINKDGNIIGTASLFSKAAFGVGSSTQGLGSNGTNLYLFAGSYTRAIGLTPSGALFIGISADVELHRDAAGILAQRRGTNAQTYRLYNTYTDASNYERVSFKWDANTFKIEPEALGTGTLRGLAFSANGSDSTPPVSLTGTWFTGGLPGTTKPHVLIEPAGTTSTAWSTSGTGLGVNAASGFTGNLLDLQVGGTSSFSVDSAGVASTGTLKLSNVGTNNPGGFGLGTAATSVLAAYVSGGRIAFAASIFGTGFILPSDAGPLGFSSAASTSPANVASSKDTVLYRDAAGILAQRNGTNAQTYRLYNTYTDASNYERVSFKWDTNTFKIEPEALGTGTLRGLAFSANGSDSTPPVSLTGTWFTGGTSTTTKPHVLIEPAGTTSTTWDTSGTGLGVNAASGFTGNLLDLQVGGTSKAKITSDGTIYVPGGTNDGSRSLRTTAQYLSIGTSGGAIVLYGTSIYGSNIILGRFGLNVAQLNGTAAFDLNWNSDVGLKRDQAGVVAITDGSTGTGYLKQTPVAVSALPAAATVGAGTRGFVSDSTVAASGNFGATVAGGGSNNVPVFSDGTNWLIG